MTKNYFSTLMTEDEHFVETKAYGSAVRTLRNFRHVLLNGSPGTGKTRMAVHIILNMVRENPKVFAVRKVHSPSHLEVLDQKQNQIVFVDNIFGTGHPDADAVNLWDKNFKFFNISRNAPTPDTCSQEEGKLDDLKGIYFIFTSRTHPVNAAKRINRKHRLLQPGVVVDLSSQEHALESSERKDILLNQFLVLKKDVPAFVDNNTEALVAQCTDEPHGFPLCAKLFASEEKFINMGAEFFANPHHHVLDLIRRKVEKSYLNRNVFLILLFHEKENMMKKSLKQETNPIALDFTDEKYCQGLLEDRKLQDLTTIEEEPFDVCEFAKAANNLGKLLCKPGKGFRFVHDSVHEAVEVYFMESYFDKAIDIIDLPALVQKIHVDHPSPYLVLCPEQYPTYISRLVQEVFKGNASEICNSAVWKNSEFVKHFGEHIREQTPQCQKGESQVCDCIDNLILSVHKSDQSQDHGNFMCASFQSGAVKLGFSLLELLQDNTVIGKEDSVLEQCDVSMDHESRNDTMSDDCRRFHTRLSCALIHACRISLPDDCTFIDLFVLFKQHKVNHSYCAMCYSRNLHDITPSKNGGPSARQLQKGISMNHQCALEAATLHKNDDAVLELLKHGAVIPHSSWRGWPFLHMCAKSDDKQLCNHKFVEALEMFHSSNTKWVGSNWNTEDSNYKSIAEIIDTEYPNNILGFLCRIISEIELTPEILETFEKLNVFLCKKNQNCDKEISKTAINIDKLVSDIQTGQSINSGIPFIASDKGHYFIQCLVHAVVKTMLSDAFLLRRDLSVSEVQNIDTIPNEGNADSGGDDAGTGSKRDLRKYLQARQRLMKQASLRNLVNHGCDINEQNRNGETVLIIEAMKSNPDVELIRLMLELGADPNIPDKWNNLPLHYVIWGNHGDSKAAEVAQVFIIGGADVTKTNKNKESPISLAIQTCVRLESSHTQLIQTLLRSPSFREKYEATEQSKEIPCIRPAHVVITNSFSEDQKINIIKLLIHELGNDVCKKKDLLKRTPLMLCVIHCPQMKDLLEVVATSTSAEAKCAQDSSGNTWLHYLLKSDCDMTTKTSALKMLEPEVAMVVNVQSNEQDGLLSPLMIALRQERTSLAIVKLLIRQGASVSIQNSDGLDCFSQAIEYSIHSKTSIIMDIPRQEIFGGERPEQSMVYLPESGTVQWPEHIAIERENVSSTLELLNILLDKIQNFQHVDKAKRNYLHHLVGCNLSEDDAAHCCELFIQNGVDVDAKDDFGKTPLMLAFELWSSKLKVLKSCIEGSQELKTWSQWKLYEVIAKSKCLKGETVKLLVDGGILHQEHQPAGNLFHWLAKMGYMTSKKEEDRKLFCYLATIFDIDARDRDGNTPLIKACKENAPIACIRNIVECGADVLITTEEKDTPAHLAIASERSDCDVFRLLRKALMKDGKGVNSLNENKRSPLVQAVTCKRDRIDTIDFLLKNGADVKLQDYTLSTVLHLCVEQPHKTDYDVQRILAALLKLEQVPEIVNKKNTSDLTALNIAASIKTQSRVLSMIRLLEVKGCKVDSLDANERTPLFNCIDNMRHLGYSPCIHLERLTRVCILLGFGAKNSVDICEKSLSDLCKEHQHHQEIRQLILQPHIDKQKMKQMLDSAVISVQKHYKPQNYDLPLLAMDSLEKPLATSVSMSAMFLCDDELSLANEFQYDENTTSDWVGV